MSALSTLFEQFIRERRYLKNVTPKTVIWYQSAFDALTRSVAVTAPNDLTKPIFQDFVVRLRQRGRSPVSCNTYVKAINAFLAWLHAEGHLSTALFKSALLRDSFAQRRRAGSSDAQNDRLTPSYWQPFGAFLSAKRLDGSGFSHNSPASAENPPN